MKPVLLLFLDRAKEIVERRHGEPIKFLFLPKLGLLGSRASTKKKLFVNSEQLLSAVSKNSIFAHENTKKQH